MAFNFEFPYTDPHFFNDDWLLKKMKELLELVAGLEEWMKEYESAYEELKQMIEDIENGNFPESIINAFYSWMSKNALDLVGSLVKMVMFGLTDDGYYVAYIPESWADIIFLTSGLDITIPDVDYGHLILEFNV